MRRFFWYLAGIDRDVMATCPRTDRLWATHLGVSLLLSFLVVSGITFHATGYVIEAPLLRGAVAAVVALTVFMFDRALYQADWFHQGVDAEPGAWGTAKRLFTLSVRLAMSFGVATVLSVFLELSIFSGAITARIQADDLATNAAVYEEMKAFEKAVDAEIGQKAEAVARLRLAYDQALGDPVDEETRALRAVLQKRLDEIAARRSALDGALAAAKAEMDRYREDMAAEEFGVENRPGNTGQRGFGPRWRFAEAQFGIAEEKARAIEAEIGALAAEEGEITRRLYALAEAAKSSLSETRGSQAEKAIALLGQINKEDGELEAMRRSRNDRIAANTERLVAAGTFIPPRDDPLTRMTAYRKLMDDPKDGPAIERFSWMTKFFIIFLEVVPVLAKILFSPPSVYAVRISANVERAKRIARQELIGEDAKIEDSLRTVQTKKAYREASFGIMDAFLRREHRSRSDRDDPDSPDSRSADGA